MPIIDDVIAYGLKLLICGSAMGNVSAEQKAYYAHPQNRFWKNLYEVGLTSDLLKPHAFRSLLTYGIGLTDLCKEESGLDKQLSANAYDIDRLAALVVEYQPKMLVFSSLTPARAFMRGHFGVPKRQVIAGKQPQKIGGTCIFICTSTSPLYPDQQRTLKLWHEVAHEVVERQ